MKHIERLEEGLIGVLLAGMTLLAFAQVVARYAFNYSFVWALEFITVLFAWLIFLGMSYGVRVGAHIGVEVLVRTLGPRQARIAAAIAALACLAYALILLVGSVVYVDRMIDLGIDMQDMPIPQWIPRLVLPLGFVLLALRFGQVLYRVLAGKQDRLLGDEVEEALKLQPHANGDVAPTDRP
jgi:C4-dicarboxylate transporter DctQ subunit